MSDESSKKKVKKKAPKKKAASKKKEDKVEIPEPPIKRVKYDSRTGTYEHIQVVQGYILFFVQRMMERAMAHDASKLEEPEKEVWDKYTPLLREAEYGSPQYEAMLDALKPALDHHYAKNSHHPQHYPNGIDDMTLMDIVEMFCDWKASSERQNDGNLRKSLEHNKGRFKMSPQLYKIFENTMKELGY